MSLTKPNQHVSPTLYSGTVIERILFIATLTLYGACKEENIYPMAKPPMIRPTRSVATFEAPACIAHPHRANKAPI